MERDPYGPFVGRREELASLERARRDSHRYGQCVIVAGEPGIGKSRLVKQFLAKIPGSRAVIGVGRAIDHVRSPFTPWIAAFDAISAPAAHAMRTGEASRGKDALHAAVIESLRSSAQTRSTIVVLEDVHWADAASIELLHALLAHVQRIRRLQIIVTVRPSEATDAVRQLFTNAAARILDLRPLEQRETLVLVRMLLPAAQAQSVRARRIATLAGGNPFFAIELAKNRESSEIPLTLSTAIDARIAQLDAPEISVLESAAIVGEEFDLELVADIIESTPAMVARQLERAQRNGIVTDEAGRSFRFAHALTRSVLAARLTSAQRIALHERAARALERRERFDALGFAQLAYHYDGAHDRVKAYGYRMRAGALAYAVHSHIDAARFYTDAAESAEPGSLERARALARAGDALHRAPLLHDADQAYIEAIGIYRAAGAVEDAARLYQSLGRSLFNQDRFREALALMEHAIGELDPLPVDVADELVLELAMQAAEVDAQLARQWLARVDERRVHGTHTGGLYFALCAAVAATQGALEDFQHNVKAFQDNVATVHPNATYTAHFGNLAANAMFLGLPAMPLYEQCFAIARVHKLDVYEAAYASHAAFERWLHGDDAAFARFADFATGHDAPIPALHAYVLLATLLRDGPVPDINDVERLIAVGHTEFFGPLAGTFARKLHRSGDSRAAVRILDAAAERLTWPYAAWETLTAMAEFGSSAARTKAEALTESHYDAHAPAFAATAAMVRALAAERDNDLATRDVAAARAAGLYATMGWVRHEHRAREFGKPPVREERFSKRELQIAQLLQQGKSNRAMAADLFISEKTVEKHLARLYEKLQVNNRAAAVRALSQLEAK